MNLPNKLTVLRMLLIPVFLFFYLAPLRWLEYGYLWALIVFIVAALTDALDGYLARKHNLITDFGKLMDPLADKLLTMSAFIVILSNFELHAHYISRTFSGTPIVYAVMFVGMGVFLLFLILIISREFLVTSMRLIAAGKGAILAADKWGKIKTVLQMAWIIYALILHVWFYHHIPTLGMEPYASINPTVSSVVLGSLLWIYDILLFAVVFITVASGVHYCLKNRALFVDK